MILSLWIGVFLLHTFISENFVRASTTSASTTSAKYYKYSSKFGEFQTRWLKTEPSCSKDKLPTVDKELPPPVLCIHGFGGNADQFRYNLPALALATQSPSYAIDLLGYGYSDKPNPKEFGVNDLYNFENWAEQTTNFIRDEIKEPVILVCNSVGGVVGLQAAVDHPELVKGVVLIDVSLRLLNTRKMSPLQRPFVTLLQNVLRETNIGKAFFSQIAQTKPLTNILNQAYAHVPNRNGPNAVTDETVQLVLQPGLLPGAVDVFLDFISYSGGPLPEDLLPLVQCPVRLLWGEKDPWEPIDVGRSTFAPPNYPNCVDEFVVIPNAGHCPMDQEPEAVNRELLRFLGTITK
jgi:pimeloyl-ACP methyl ester carboxylesterase